MPAARRRYIPRPTDMRSLSEALSRGGMDPREWFAMGIVDAEPVQFEPGIGPLVSVTLQPSQSQVLCRTMSSVAGDGGAEYVPFVAGDEVIVAVPGGSVASGACVILGKTNNERRPFPMDSIAGQDPTTNSFAFRRSRTPMVTEYAGPYIVRQATSGALLSLDATGTVTIRDGAGGALQMSADVAGYQSADATALLQLDLSGGHVRVQMGDALFMLSKSGASPELNTLAVPGRFSLSAGAQPAAEHVVTTEALAGILVAFAALIAPTPVTPLQVAAAFTLAATTPLNAAVAAAVYGAFAAATQKPPGVPGQGQLRPGIGCTNFLVG